MRSLILHFQILGNNTSKNRKLIIFESVPKVCISKLVALPLTVIILILQMIMPEKSLKTSSSFCIELSYLLYVFQPEDLKLYVPNGFDYLGKKLTHSLVSAQI